MRELAGDITEWLVNHGYDPPIIWGVVGLLVLFLQRKNISNLNKLEPHWRRFTIAQIAVGGLLVLVGLLSALGIFPKR